MSTSEVKSALDGIAQIITGSAKQREQAKNQLLVARNQLANLPSQYASEIAEIDGYVPDGSYETLAKDEKARLQSEFQSLKADLEAELDALGVSYT